MYTGSQLVRDQVRFLGPAPEHSAADRHRPDEINGLQTWCRSATAGEVPIFAKIRTLPLVSAVHAAQSTRKNVVAVQIIAACTISYICPAAATFRNGIRYATDGIKKAGFSSPVRWIADAAHSVAHPALSASQGAIQIFKGMFSRNGGSSRVV